MFLLHTPIFHARTVSCLPLMFWEIPGIYFLFVKGKWNPVPGGQSAVTPRSEASVWWPHLSSGCRKKKLRRHGNIIQRWRKLSSSFQLIWLTFGWEETNKQNISFCQTKGLSPWSSKQTRSWTLCVRAVKQVQWISLVKSQFSLYFGTKILLLFCSEGTSVNAEELLTSSSHRPSSVL